MAFHVTRAGHNTAFPTLSHRCLGSCLNLLGLHGPVVALKKTTVCSQWAALIIDPLPQSYLRLSSHDWVTKTMKYSHLCNPGPHWARLIGGLLMATSGNGNALANVSGHVCAKTAGAAKHTTMPPSKLTEPMKTSATRH